MSLYIVNDSLMSCAAGLLLFPVIKSIMQSGLKEDVQCNVYVRMLSSVDSTLICKKYK